MFVSISVSDMDGVGTCQERAKHCKGEELEAESEEDAGSCSDSSSSSVEEGSDREKRDIIEMDETPKEERLDCESILRYLPCDDHVT